MAWVGLTEGLFPWTASGRAIANGRDQGVTKLLFEDIPEEKSGGHGMPVATARSWAAEVAHGRCTDVPPARK
jgi:pyruvate/2-oxoglutarate dehydrogenase complex dihydrolipoamide dehydrogenase (E3) component